MSKELMKVPLSHGKIPIHAGRMRFRHLILFAPPRLTTFDTSVPLDANSQPDLYSKSVTMRLAGGNQCAITLLVIHSSVK